MGDGAAVLRWAEWGPPDGPPVVCVHGLTRTGRDFDALAAALAARGRRVICPDVFGRGLSDWLPDAALYAVPTYARALAPVLRAVGREYDWVGTSMGGLVAMALLAAGEGAGTRRLVLNDVGAHLPAAALRRIAAYLSAPPPAFPDLDALERHLRAVHAPFGDLGDAGWRHLAATSARTDAAGRVLLHYDPAIARAFASAPTDDVDLWPQWEAIAAPTLVLRGESSDLLLPDTAARMATRPGARVATVPGCGHAPALMDDAQVATVLGFLDG